ncbi:hypothetical protein B4098_1711 [Heyndrickxia coagulans]|uniref:Uncharacterized protein n=1 Tax=Heyndrickxia coagulans TaxID=1398 RepID=A0A150K0Y6_HEYCO|nr:hypothetical protein B4098_1711 [Heyndrickxia coagulans]
MVHLYIESSDKLATGMPESSLWSQMTHNGYGLKNGYKKV